MGKLRVLHEYQKDLPTVEDPRFPLFTLVSQIYTIHN